MPRSYRGDHQSTYRYGDEDEKRDRPKYLEHTKTDQSPGQNEKHRTFTTLRISRSSSLPEAPTIVQRFAPLPISQGAAREDGGVRAIL